MWLECCESHRRKEIKRKREADTTKSLTNKIRKRWPIFFGMREGKNTEEEKSKKRCG